MDYDTLLDPEIRAYIRRTAESYPGEAVDHTIEEQREFYNASVTQFREPRPEVVEVSEATVGYVQVRIYSAGDPTRTVLYCHGGGWVVGDLNSHDDICAEICAQTGYRVVAVDYRLAPEHQHPAQFDDAYAVAEWIAETYPGGMVLAGDSAGGALVACVAHKARGQIEGVLGQVLIYPVLGPEVDRGSYIEHAEAPMLTRVDMSMYNKIRTGGEMPAEADATLLPLMDTDFTGLPPTVLFSADADPLRDDCRDYRDALKDAGVKVHWTNEEGLVHSYLRARTTSSKARDSFERISVAIEALGQELWGWD